MIRKMLVVAAAVAMPLGAVSAIADTAGAAKGPPDTGSVTCAVSQTATLSNPFHFGGNAVKKATTTLDASAPTCTGTGNGVTGAVTKTVVIKSKYAKGVVSGDCTALTSTTVSPFKLAITWSDNTKSTLAMIGGGQHGAGFLVTGSVTKGSFLGDSVSIQANLSGTDISAILACGVGGPDVSVLHLTSAITIS
jgi:hypothetical protein